MSIRLRLALGILVFLVVANFAWRLWADWGLVTVDVNDARVSEVVRGIGKQGGIQLVTNAPSDATVTMHVHKVPLLRALQVLAINTGGSWTAAYLVAPQKTAIRGVLAEFTSGTEVTGWKKFTLPLPPMGGFGGADDPREEKWRTTAAAEGTLQGYLAQGSRQIGAQFWAPEEWNPSIAKTPSAGVPRDVVHDLARAGGGESAEVFLLTVQTPAPQTADASPDGPRPGSDGSFNRPGPPRDGAGGPPGGPPSEAMRTAMEAHERARIDKLPTDKKAAALAEFEDRKKFFESLENLTPEERSQKIREHIEADMRGNGPSSFENHMTQMDAMHTAEQRTKFFRGVVDHKAQMSAK